MSLSDLWQRLRPGPLPADAGSDSSSDRGDGEVQQPPDPVLKRKLQTEAARKAAIKAKARRSALKQIAPPVQHMPADKYLPDLQPGGDISKAGDSKRKRKRRLRLIYSWFKAACARLNSFFSDENVVVHHVIKCSIIDDTNMRLSKTVEAGLHSSRVIPVLNNCQTCTACYELKDSNLEDCEPTVLQHKSFTLHTPMTCLPRANAETIVEEGNPASEKSQEIEQALDAAGFRTGEDEDGNDMPGSHDVPKDCDEDWLDKLLQLEGAREDLSFAEVNQKRKQLTFQAFSEKSFIDRIHILEDLVHPNLEAMYQLFNRTGHLNELANLPCPAERRRTLMLKCFGISGKCCILIQRLALN
eukprot:Skav210732  [mRNA]  locus=scaffold449:124:2310:+ [translate_table: standard]